MKSDIQTLERRIALTATFIQYCWPSLLSDIRELCRLTKTPLRQRLPKRDGDPLDSIISLLGIYLDGNPYSMSSNTLAQRQAIQSLWSELVLRLERFGEVQAEPYSVTLAGGRSEALSRTLGPLFLDIRSSENVVYVGRLYRLEMYFRVDTHVAVDVIYGDEVIVSQVVTIDRFGSVKIEFSFPSRGDASCPAQIVVNAQRDGENVARWERELIVKPHWQEYYTGSSNRQPPPIETDLIGLPLLFVQGGAPLSFEVKSVFAHNNPPISSTRYVARLTNDAGSWEYVDGTHDGHSSTFIWNPETPAGSYHLETSLMYWTQAGDFSSPKKEEKAYVLWDPKSHKVDNAAKAVLQTARSGNWSFDQKLSLTCLWSGRCYQPDDFRVDIAMLVTPTADESLYNVDFWVSPFLRDCRIVLFAHHTRYEVVLPKADRDGYIHWHMIKPPNSNKSDSAVTLWIIEPDMDPNTVTYADNLRGGSFYLFR